MICWVWIWFNPAAHTRQIWDQVGCWWTAISDVSNMLCYHQLLIDLTHCVFILKITFNQMKQHTDLKNKTKKTILEQTNTNGNDQTKKTNRNNVDSFENDSDRLVLWAKEWFLPIHPWTELYWEGGVGVGRGLNTEYQFNLESQGWKKSISGRGHHAALSVCGRTGLGNNLYYAIYSSLMEYIICGKLYSGQMTMKRWGPKIKNVLYSK